MPCYSYTTNSSITAGNIEIVTAASGNTYSYNNLAWVCEFPVENQILVYTRPTPTGTETLQVLGTHYNISGTDIVFTAGNTPTGEVVIRRTTAANKMLYVFNDGAKLTAEQLNGAFHQLLFALQEKDLAKSTTNYIYTISGTVGAWSGATAYVVGNIVSQGNSIYRCISPTTNNQPPNATYWALVNPSQAGFVLTGNNAPISVNVSSLSQGKALVWNGSEFRADVFTGAFNDLTDVTLTAPAANQLLRYNGSQWVNITPSFDITLSSPVLSDRAFYTSSITTSYTNNNTSISAPALLDRFKSNSNRWVLTDPPTVYHIISELIPGSDAPENWFSSINSTVNNLSQTLSNPVKAKLYWNLRTHKSNISNNTANNSDTLDNYKTLFYDSPDELYSVIGYNISGAGPIKFHGVSNTSVIYKDNPYYYSVSNPSSFKSKIEGYGIKNFYLSVPECRSSNFLGLPTRSGNAYYIEIPSNITTKCNALGNETDETIRDYYLLGLRELAFAANLSNASVSGFASNSDTVKKRMTLSRYLKGKMLRVNYNWGLSHTVTFARLEDPNDTGSLCLWKIPKQIIYYNKGAMALANTSVSTPLLVDGEIDAAIRKTTRFNGQSRFHEPVTNYTNSTLTIDGNGTLFKADEYWADWVNKWSDGGNDKKDYQFMESDIEWIVSGITNTTSNYNLYDYAASLALRWNTSSGWRNGRIFPWLYRSLEPRGSNINNSGRNDWIGTLLHNVDTNTLFSTADSFIPDPTDEYVFRVVLNKDLTPVFKQNNITTLKSAILLEYGFSERTNNRFANTALTLLDDIFKNPEMPATNYRALSRLKESDIRVYVKTENIETISGNERVVITLGIRIPRLKSIGYAKVFRRFDIYNTPYPIHSYSANSNQSNDTEIDSGPWNFTFANGNISLLSYSANNLPALGISTDYGSPFSIPASTYNETWATSQNSNFQAPKEFVSGRNEAAVKFTRLGIPSTLWIRLSVLNTNASYDLINASGFINTEPV